MSDITLYQILEVSIDFLFFEVEDYQVLLTSDYYKILLPCGGKVVEIRLDYPERPAVFEGKGEIDHEILVFPDFFWDAVLVRVSSQVDIPSLALAIWGSSVKTETHPTIIC